MVTCLSEVFIWSLKNQYYIPDNVIGCHAYHDKGEQVNIQEQIYYEEKQQFTEARDLVWSPRNKRPERLRDNLREVEELMSQFKCVQVRWKNGLVLQLVLSNCCVVTFFMSSYSGDVHKIILDKSLVGKITSETVSDAYLTDQYLIACHHDGCRLDYIYFSKRPSLSEAAKRIDKLASWEPKIVQHDIPGPKGRRLERRFSSNIHHDLLLVWWYQSCEEPWPWTPMSSEKERANMIVLSVNGPRIEVLTYTKTELAPLHAAFSAIQPHKIYSLEQTTTSKSDTIAQACIYEVVQGKIQRVAVTNIPLKSTVVCQCRNPQEDKLLLACSDSALVMHDEHKKIPLYTRAAFSPSLISWHPGGSVVFVASSRGDIQVFDMALSPLRIQLVSEDPSSEKYLRLGRFFRCQQFLKQLHWCPYGSDSTTGYSDSLFLLYDKGPPVLLLFHLGMMGSERLSPLQLVREYIKYKQIDEAVSLLSSLNWDTEGQMCYSCLSAIVNHLLRLPLNADREAQLEATLGTFYAPKPPISEVIILEYRDPISRLARRFFHYLLRYTRFDKAFLLAVDIGARDLFMDIHYMALDKGETALAEVAKRKAEQLDYESLDQFDDDPLLNAGMEGHGQAGIQERLIDQLPASRQHPWQSDYYNQQSLPNHNIDYLHETNGDHLNDVDFDDYAAALMDQPTRQSNGNHQTQGETEEGKPVKVIHFGIV
ncbi:WD repeat-containing and planar cell polarity effector protein fritz homolog [Gigantopelta aegis]|uniref:WD repeat-containing and planar cell polarity effector protein fritz homolog n=1 Tax=Gigantopelta aegis TaxID=1735272 RepID=UPI001B88C750|nr:WD repeat-containing and planar cell polarity effector protein fritz homolog [Gigantopelta aegis]